ncbi:hypothetical protein FY036_03440 [Mesorhizobium microcysteis]|uniref:Uncharacterized protein n=1 Tax=Neoaquamicrobium microcysteis TaxID=2682781 RepID=A0A5D4H2R2_9HYPH|nr:hypothetical protein [Mesorhizobium microcysteis]TYR34887.1 hypothetical protein FY036_03440 [Mesorhizobium microcysteis]
MKIPTGERKTNLPERSNLRISELMFPKKSAYRLSFEQRSASEKWFRDLIAAFYRRNNTSKYANQVDFLESCAFFTTMTFSTYRVEREKRKLGLAKNDFSVEMDNFQKLYNGLARKQFGSGYNLSKFEKKLPLAIACIDYEGSRYYNEIPENPKNIHVHAIWVVHPEEIDEFLKIINGAWFKLKFQNGLHTDRIRFDPYLERKDKKGRWGGYAAKTWIKMASLPNGAADLLRIYPNSNYGGKPYQAQHKYGRTNKILELMRRINAGYRSNSGSHR